VYEHRSVGCGLVPADLRLDTARLDQHLLCSPAAVRTLVDAAQPTRQDVIADLGAGTGVITRELASRAFASIYAIEIDDRFAPLLERLSRDHRHIDVRVGDILTSRLPDVTKVVASPPFRITEHLVDWLRRLPVLVSASLVMGRSFGVSATAVPGSRHYDRLSLDVQASFTAQVISSLPPACFHPPTRTSACVVRLVPRRPPARVDAFVAGAFARQGGMRVKDLLWQLGARGSVPGPPSTRREIATALRSSSVVREIYQLRLQQVRSIDLSRLMAELRRLTEPR
jgi:16S rRNA A1518/A1519 N6-dimethyltransferase RsmA/KsgA/DIM1 with predicted DNA glycosylase/AP lyase activity